MTWNYRVIRHKEPDGEYYYQVHEVYYDNQGEINGWSTNASIVYGDSYQDLRHDMLMHRKAFDKPVLEEFEGKLLEVE